MADTMTMSRATSPAAIALNRFGLGARPDEAAPADPKGWLRAQLDRFEPRPAPFASLPPAGAIAIDYSRQRREVRSTADDAAKKSARRELRMEMRGLYRAAVNARAETALVTPAPFIERLVHFWSNHFAVSADKVTVSPLAGPFEAEAIRPNVLGRFQDMLLAVERHPAMQLYLDQVRSVGPGSPFAARVAGRNATRKRGLNENLAREIMELHTLGVRSGYSQSDVTEFARAMTGWSVGGLGPGAGRDAAEPGAFLFRPQLHEPGTRTIMGKIYDQPGEEQAVAVLRDLADAPATATHIATKLARHFAGDAPPPPLVDRLAAAFTQSGGDLPTVYRALIDSSEAWAPAPLKFKTPWEWTISVMRGTGRTTLDGVEVAPMLVQLGQPVWRPGSPAGYDDIAASWAAPDALVRRVELAQRFATQIGQRFDPRTLAGKLLPGSVSAGIAAAIARAESVPTGLALLLVSPDFQRR